jgi:hypothetical protein
MVRTIHEIDYEKLMDYIRQEMSLPIEMEDEKSATD